MSAVGTPTPVTVMPTFDRSNWIDWNIFACFWLSAWYRSFSFRLLPPSSAFALAGFYGYRSKLVYPATPGGKTCVIGGLTFGPAATWTSFDRSIAYSIA